MIRRYLPMTYFDHLFPSDAEDLQIYLLHVPVLDVYEGRTRSMDS